MEDQQPSVQHMRHGGRGLSGRHLLTHEQYYKHWKLLTHVEKCYKACSEEEDLEKCYEACCEEEKKYEKCEKACRSTGYNSNLKSYTACKDACRKMP